MDIHTIIIKTRQAVEAKEVGMVVYKQSEFKDEDMRQVQGTKFKGTCWKFKNIPVFFISSG